MIFYLLGEVAQKTLTSYYGSRSNTHRTFKIDSRSVEWIRPLDIYVFYIISHYLGRELLNQK